jgi:hypothetical protein
MRIFVKNSTKVALAAFAFMVMAGSDAFAQLKFGLRIAPTVAFTRVRDDSKTDLPGTDIKYSSNGAGIGFSGGLVVDYFLKPNYAVSSGINFTIKKANINAGDDLGAIDWNLQMLQIPVTMKLYTNELVPDMKLYFQLGGCLDFVISQNQNNFSPKGVSTDFVGSPFRPIDVSIILGTGVEYRLAESTTLFGGFSYNRGLINMITKYGAFNEYNTIPGIADANDRYAVRIDMVSLDMGIKF